MEAVRSPKTSVIFCQTAECNVLEDSTLGVNVKNYLARLEILFIFVLNVDFYSTVSVELDLYCHL
jgi:hypothetical protein